MDAAAILLVATPLPILVYYISMYPGEHRLSDLFGAISAVWAFLAVLLMFGGLPGMLLFPVMLGISALGGFLEYGRSRRNWELVQGIVLVIALMVLVYLMEVA
jgi:hypothetical protein